MRNTATALLFTAFLATAQTQQVHPNPDCQFFFTVSAGTPILPAGNGFDNRQQGCTTWNFSYANGGLTGLTITLETAAATGSGTAGSFTAGFQVQGSTISGTNAATNTTAGFWWARGYAPFVRVHLTGITGSGAVNGAVFGWRKPNAGGGGGGGSITCLTGDVAAGSGSGCTTATVQGIETVPFCSGYTPTNGQFVQYTTGGSPNPCYSAATASGGGGGLTLVEEHSASNSAALNFTTCISSTYDDYEIRVLNIIPATSTAAMLVQMSSDGGSTYDTGSNYAWASINMIPGVGTGDGTSSATGMLIGAVQETSAAATTFSGNYQLANPLSATAFKTMVGLSWSLDVRNVPTFKTGGTWTNGAYNITTAVNAFRIISTSGNITSGTVRCYGYSK